MSGSKAVDEPEFSRWRSYLWPVHNYELRKLVPMLLIFFLITFDYNILRTLKDTVVVTAKSSGAEVIPFIKVWVMFPSAVLMTILFTRLSSCFSRENVFYIMIGGFLSYFVIFILILHPARDSLHPHALADRMQQILPLGCKGLIAMFRNWTFTIFYVMSELWSSAILSVLFWGFANQVTRVSEAKRFYGLFGIGANFSGVVAGQVSVFISRHTYNPNIPYGKDAWDQSLLMLVSLVLLAGLGAIFLFRWLNSCILSDPLYYDAAAATEDKNLKDKKLSLRQTFAYLSKSKYLTCIAIIVLSYNLVINLTEVIWKHEVRELYPNPSDYSLYTNQISTIIGVIATFCALFVSGNSMRVLGWTFTAMLTPMILFFTSLGFFLFFFMKGHLAEVVMALTGMTPLMLVVFAGSVQNILSRAAKYSVYDATKEMAFIPLSAEWKLKGKAAIDGVCSRLGKSSGSVVHQTLLLLFSTFTASAPYVALVLFAVIAVWMGATRILGGAFNEMTLKKPERKETLSEALSLANRGKLQEQKAG
ncbi:ADP,ATP carrier protein 1 [Neochlamydia sp. AcF65]|nr:MULTISPECIES: Npt1/Npt2 family nucleotide transporter [unclassified Neochlamydia]MBS4167252.1 ADP,ATP carrier protein 1 [Neochlamydia sp. AcF65]MBS4169666.1 ADP,ATP carrier protein 1 [Neochlamydia sp. AcF95]NGY95179.1 ADP,ATP carrier protein 1 [Neochlamydia sp. AcF84]